jgi:sialic acid synthase SpsE
MTYIIAEVGVNHQGDPAIARDYVEALKDIGADAVKFQLFDHHQFPKSEQKMLKKLELKTQGMLDLKEMCDDLGIDFICTPFDVRALRWLADLEPKMKYIKIGSGMLHDDRLLEAARKCKIPIILSTGMATINEITTAVYQCSPNVIMHCVSAYPTQPEDIMLGAIPKFVKVYHGRDIGLSDHSMSTVIPAAAVVMGATFIEKHVTFDRDWSGPDHHMSITMGEFSEMIDGIREVEKAIDGGVTLWQRPACEDPVKQIVKEREVHMKTVV